MKREANHARPARRSLRQRGLTLIEASLVLGMMAIVTVVIGNTLADNAERVKGKATADRLAQVHEASAAYIKANYAKLVAAAPNAPNALAIPVTGASGPSGTTGTKSLVEGGFLPSSFQNVNPYGQQHAVLVRRLGDNGLEALVTTVGGQVIPDAQLGRIATQRGAAGGFVASDPVGTGNAGWVTGSFGGWRTQASTWGAAATRPSAGHVQSTLAFEDGGMIADYLYRNDIGIPEANRMNTAIDMGRNNINNAETVNAQNVVAQLDLWARRDVRADNNVSAGNDVAAGQNVRAGASVIAQGNVSAAGNVSAGRDLGVGGNAGIVGNLNVRGQATVRGDIGTESNLHALGSAYVGQDVNAGRNLSVGQDAYVGRMLVANQFSLDAVVFGGSRGLSTAQGIRLGDLLPRTVAQYSYVVNDNTYVYKPTCVGGYGNARIMVYRQTDSNQASVQWSMTGSWMGGVSANTGAVDVVDSVQAIDNGAGWIVRWTGNPASGAAARRGIAHTYCYIP